MQELPQAWTDSLDFYEMFQGRLSPHTVANRRSAVKVMARALAVESPADVTRMMLVHYLAADLGRRRSQTSAAVHAKCLRTFFRWWAAEEQLPDPMAGIPLPAMEVKQDTPLLSQNQLAALRDATAGRDFKALRDRAIIMLLLASGLRRFELLALDVEDLDVKEGTAIVRRGKGNKARVGSFGPPTKIALTRYLAARKKHLAGREEPALFLAWTGRMTTAGLRDMLHRRGELAGVEGVRPHVFRHTWAHTLQSSPMKEADICQLAGWSSTAQLRRYGALRATERALAAGRAYPADAFG